MGGANTGNALVIAPAWGPLVARPPKGTVLLVGGADSGKTSLALYLYRRWSEQGLRTALLDCDVGQSALGTPTTMTLRVAWGDDHRDFVYFVGSVSPRRYMLPMLVGVHCLHEKAQALGAETVIVDTTGLVDPAQGGTALKDAKIELLMPCHIVALARGAELNPILRLWTNHPSVHITRLPVSPHARSRNRTERAAWRQHRWQSYFREALPLTFPLGQFAAIDWLLPTAQRICAFVDAEGLCLGLGRVAYLDRKAQMITVETPLRSLEGVVGLRFGPPRLEEQVLGNAKPG